MKRKDALKLLAEYLEQGCQDGMIFHPKFFEELRDLLKKASGYEKEILNLLVRQLGYVRDFRRKVNEADGNEKIKHSTRDYYSLHLKGKGFNLRFLMGFLPDDSPIFLVAFYERSGKKVSNYSTFVEVLDERYEEMESENRDEE